jgi:Methylase involved in ubiquinone/menaquinone biosynthesis
MKNYKDDARKTFDKMATKYENHYYGSQSRILYKKVKLKIEKFKNEFILDLGCGKGLFLEILKEYKSHLYGADISPEMIKNAQERIANYAELKVADSENLPWVDNTFDIIVCILSFHHYPSPEKSIEEMKRVLKNNGHITIAELWLPAPLRYLTNLYMKSKFNRTGDVKVYSKNEWLNMLENAGFININIDKTNSIYLIISAEITK